MTAPLASATCLAVQQDAAAISVDWQGFIPDHPGGRFHGAVFVLDADGVYRTHLPWVDPTDQAADAGLVQAGWQRTQGWRSDDYGRRVAAVRPVPGAPSGTDQSLAGRAPDEVFASIRNSIATAKANLDRLPSAAYYRKPAGAE